MAEIKAAKDSNFTPKADKIDKTGMLKSFLLSFYLGNSESLPREMEKFIFWVSSGILESVFSTSV